MFTWPMMGPKSTKSQQPQAGSV